MEIPRAAGHLAGLVVIVVGWMAAPVGWAQVAPGDALWYVDLRRGLENLAEGPGRLELVGGAALDGEGCLEFTTADQYAEIDRQGMKGLSDSLRQVDALSIGGWFACRTLRQQVLLGRGTLRIGQLGEVLFPPADEYINFCLGSDAHGFVLGAINGNGSLPFPHVTINRLAELTWQQLVVVKTRSGHHIFYQNGRRIHDDRHAIAAPSRQPWREADPDGGPPVRLAVAGGGRIGEAWIVGRELGDGEVAADYQAKRGRYRPAPPGETIAVRDMDTQGQAERPALDRNRARAALLELLGAFPDEPVELAPREEGAVDCGTYVRRKVSIQVQPGDRMPAYLLVPKARRGPVPAIVCFYGTTSGAGKDTTVGLSGRRPGTPGHPNLRFAVDMVEAGFVALAPDYLRDGERIHPGDAPYDTTRFYRQFPKWSIHGKDVWDTMRAIDYLQTLDEVDPERIGMVGHSYGGHSTLFATALEPRIRAAVANGPVSAFREHGMHWAVPRGGRSSQSLPAMRPYILEPDRPLPITFAQIMALAAPRPLLVGQAVGERRPGDERSAALVRQVYLQQGAADRVRFIWYAGDHDFPPEARRAAVAWLQRWLGRPAES